jgi:hypothetical protein
MRKIMILVTLAVSYIAVAGALNADNPPACDPCPWVR